MNAMEQLLEFLARLKDEKIQFTPGCERAAIMVSIISPVTYYEVEFFADGHIDVQTWGPAGDVQDITLPGVTEMIVKALNGDPDDSENKH